MNLKKILLAGIFISSILAVAGCSKASKSDPTDGAAVNPSINLTNASNLTITVHKNANHMPSKETVDINVHNSTINGQDISDHLVLPNGTSDINLNIASTDIHNVPANVNVKYAVVSKNLSAQKITLDKNVSLDVSAFDENNSTDFTVCMIAEGVKLSVCTVNAKVGSNNVIAFTTFKATIASREIGTVTGIGLTSASTLGGRGISDHLVFPSGTTDVNLNITSKDIHNAQANVKYAIVSKNLPVKEFKSNADKSFTTSLPASAFDANNVTDFKVCMIAGDGDKSDCTVNAKAGSNHIIAFTTFKATIAGPRITLTKASTLGKQGLDQPVIVPYNDQNGILNIASGDVHNAPANVIYAVVSNKMDYAQEIRLGDDVSLDASTFDGNYSTDFTVCMIAKDGDKSNCTVDAKVDSNHVIAVDTFKATIAGTPGTGTATGIALTSASTLNGQGISDHLVFPSGTTDINLNIASADIYNPLDNVKYAVVSKNLSVQEITLDKNVPLDVNAFDGNYSTDFTVCMIAKDGDKSNCTVDAKVDSNHVIAFTTFKATIAGRGIGSVTGIALTNASTLDGQGISDHLVLSNVTSGINLNIASTDIYNSPANVKYAVVSKNLPAQELTLDENVSLDASAFDENKATDFTVCMIAKDGDLSDCTVDAKVDSNHVIAFTTFKATIAGTAGIGTVTPPPTITLTSASTLSRQDLNKPVVVSESSTATLSMASDDVHNAPANVKYAVVSNKMDSAKELIPNADKFLPASAFDGNYSTDFKICMIAKDGDKSDCTVDATVGGNVLAVATFKATIAGIPGTGTATGIALTSASTLNRQGISNQVVVPYGSKKGILNIASGDVYNAPTTGVIYAIASKSFSTKKITLDEDISVAINPTYPAYTICMIKSPGTDAKNNPINISDCKDGVTVGGNILAVAKFDVTIADIAPIEPPIAAPYKTPNRTPSMLPVANPELMPPSITLTKASKLGRQGLNKPVVAFKGKDLKLNIATKNIHNAPGNVRYAVVSKTFSAQEITLGKDIILTEDDFNEKKPTEFTVCMIADIGTATDCTIGATVSNNILAVARFSARIADPITGRFGEGFANKQLPPTETLKNVFHINGQDISKPINVPGKAEINIDPKNFKYGDQDVEFVVVGDALSVRLILSASDNKGKLSFNGFNIGDSKKLTVYMIKAGHTEDCKPGVKTGGNVLAVAQVTVNRQ